MSKITGIGVIIDTDLDQFKSEMIKRPKGECLSLKNLLSVEYLRVRKAMNSLTDKAIEEGKQNDPEYVTTLQGMNLQMFKIEQKVDFLSKRIEDLRID